MKTPCQEKYERLIVNMIKSSTQGEENRTWLEDFTKYSELQYDLFCEQIYHFLKRK